MTEIGGDFGVHHMTVIRVLRKFAEDQTNLVMLELTLLILPAINASRLAGVPLNSNHVNAIVCPHL